MTAGSLSGEVNQEFLKRAILSLAAFVGGLTYKLSSKLHHFGLQHA